MKSSAWIIPLLVLATAGLVEPAPGQTLPHRDDFRMNFIGGGDLRRYILEVVAEDDLWAHSMHTLGIFHNHMHEVMTELARHDERERERGNAQLVPEIGARISGGIWTEYRENLERAGEESTWRDLVQITEIMHDRVHHVMFEAVLYDHESRGRAVDLDEYMEEGRRFPFEETVPAPGERRLQIADGDAFRAMTWRADFEQERLHSSLQQMVVFQHMLLDLMDQWARHGAEKPQAACRPPAYEVRVSGDVWRAYAESVAACDDTRWRELVQVTALMHDRIHHMLYRVERYLAAEHGVG